MRMDIRGYTSIVVFSEPNPPASMEATGRGSDSIDITWTNPSSGVAVEFNVSWYPESDLSQLQHASVLHNERFTSYDLIVNAATPGDIYQVEIVSQSGNQRSEAARDTAVLGGFLQLWFYSLSLSLSLMNEFNI